MSMRWLAGMVCVLFEGSLGTNWRGERERGYRGHEMVSGECVTLAPMRDGVICLRE